MTSQRQPAGIRKDAQRGTWFFRIDGPPDNQGNRTQIKRSGFSTRREAEAALARVKVEIEEHSYIRRSSRTVEDLVTEWLPKHIANKDLRASTADSYQRVCRVHILPSLGQTPVQSLTVKRVEDFYTALLTQGRRDQRKGDALSRRSVQYIASILRAALDYGVRHGYLKTNPATVAQLPPVTRRPSMTCWTDEELDAFLEATSDRRDYPLLHFLASTGVRRGEALGLRWSDLADNRGGRFELTGSASISQTLTVVNHEMVFSRPKTQKGVRLVALDEETVAILRAWRARQIQERLSFGDSYTNTELVFTEPDGGPVHPEAFSKRFDRLVARLIRQGRPIKRIRVHDLRHTHATLALKAGVHPKIVSDRLGHASIAITLDTYSHPDSVLHKEAAEAIASLRRKGRME